MPMTVYSHPCWCTECKEPCRPVEETISYSGTHCTSGRSGIYRTGLMLSNCCSAEMTNEKYTVRYFDVLNDYSMVESEEPEDLNKYRWKQDAILQGLEYGTCKETHEMHYVRLTTVGEFNG